MTHQEARSLDSTKVIQWNKRIEELEASAELPSCGSAVIKLLAVNVARTLRIREATDQASPPETWGYVKPRSRDSNLNSILF